MTPSTPAADLTARSVRPRRLGVFGRRGVGKTTLLSMLYREAAGGRLPGLRLAAADARTAAYLAEKVLQLEAGQTLPATLDETELRFHLYQGNTSIDLVVLDYQGEHVELGREEPVREFLRDCDAVWLCLDAAITEEPGWRLRAEQEVEQLVEDYLATRREGEPHRPMALVVTKADLLGDVAEVRSLADAALGMTRHALASHCPWHEVFAISSLGHRGAAAPEPTGLDAPLAWLVHGLREQDVARLARLWQLAPADLAQLARATQAFARRYPDDPRTALFQSRLREAVWRRRGRRVLTAAAGLLALTALLWSYDVYGARQLDRALAERADESQALRDVWSAYQTWYPTRYLFRFATLEQKRDQVAELGRQARLSELRRLADDPDADPEAAWAEFLRFREEFPGHDLDDMDLSLRERLKSANDRRRDERAAREKADRDRKGQAALRELERAEPSTGLAGLIDLASRLAKEHPDASSEPELLRKRAGYLRRLDERDFEDARDYSRRNPTNFHTRRQKYQAYLDHHPDGAFVTPAREAMRQVAAEWDRHDFRAIRDLYTSSPFEVKELRLRARAYLSAHPDGKYRDSAKELVRFCDRVSEEGEYKVVLKSGSFSKKVAHLVSRGAYLSVEIEVAGVRYGPSTIVKRSYEPEWDYEFPRKVRWKLGDPVRVIVTDNYYWKRRVADVTFEDSLALGKLTGEVEVTYGSLTFSSDFALPKLPKVE
jgi:hypothetical protein